MISSAVLCNAHPDKHAEVANAFQQPLNLQIQLLNSQITFLVTLAETVASRADAFWEHAYES